MPNTVPCKNNSPNPRTCPELSRGAARPRLSTFQYLLMVEAGKARRGEAGPGEAGRVCVFESSAGERFSVVRPGMSEEREAQVLESLREILGEEGYLGGEG